MTEPLVSVLVPLYNHENYIEGCLQSIFDEDYPNIELVVLDDGSRDRSLTIAKQWILANQGRFARTQLWTQPNVGICRTLNRLVMEAQGSYLTLVASDDALKTGGIRARVRFLERHSKLIAVFGDAEVMDEHGDIQAGSTIECIHHGCKAALADPRRITKELMLRWSVPGPVFLARRTAWDPALGIGPYDETLSVEDRDFYLRLLSRDALAFLDLAVARYRIHSQNVSRPPGTDSGSDSLQHKILLDVQKSARKNMDLFSGWNKAILYLLIKNNQYKMPRKWIRYRVTRNILKMALFLNCFGLPGRGTQDDR
jgi:glycosyltransferase involved in cell wall biosynthesis